MKNALFSSAILVALCAVLFVACSNDQSTSPPDSGEGLIQGTLLDAVTSVPLGGVAVTATIPQAGSRTATSAADGKFEVRFPVDSLVQVALTFRKTGYTDTTISVEVRAGTTVTVDFLLVSLSASRGPAVVAGLVTDAATNTPVGGVTVNLQGSISGTRTATTDLLGRYRFSLNLDSTDIVIITFSKTGYIDTTMVLEAQVGVTKTVQTAIRPTGAGRGPAVLTGLITDAATGAPLTGVTVAAQGSLIGSRTTTTDLLGRYRFSFTLDSTDIVVLRLSKSGYRDTTKVLEVASGTTVTALIPMRLTAGGSSGGTAQTIAFLGATPQEVSVYGVGGLETAALNWEVRDSVGIPINDANAVDITFSILGGTMDNGYISPLVVRTNPVGRAATTFNSGIRSGVVQIVATVTVGTRAIVSSPVRVIVRAGFPDQAHFSVGAERHNFPAIGILGETDAITVLVGDRYSNPVAANTAVYFRSSAGVILPSVFTNANGQGSVNLISGNPGPFGGNAALPYGDGYHWVVARTIGQGGSTVIDSTLILWTGHSMIGSVTPSSFNIPNAASQDFTFVISDYLGHPLSEGTTISVSVSVPPPPDPNTPVNQVQLAFGRNGTVTLDDVIFPGPGTTQFGFRLSDGSPDSTIPATAASVTISVSGPNGNAYYTIEGTVH